MHTLTAVTLPGPSAFVIRSLARLDTIVPAEIIMEMIPAHDTFAPSSEYIRGHAEPNNGSGRPRLINAI